MSDEQYLYQGLQLSSTATLEGILFIMDDVNNYDELVSAVGNNTEVVLLDSRGNGLEQMANYLAGYQGLSFIEVASHGSSDSVNLGSLTLNSSNLNDNAALLSQLGSALSDTGDLLLLGCGIAADETSTFLNNIADLTGADIAASSNGTGRGENSDWVLESSVGEIDSENNLQFYVNADPNVYLASQTGTVGADDLSGTAQNDVISAIQGNDTVSGLDGNDTIYGGGEIGDQDILYGGNGNDFLYGEDGNDILYGEAGNDALSGATGTDILYGGEGNDTIIPGNDNDLGYGGNGNDWIWGGKGDDTLYGEAGTDTISGDAGNDILYGGADNDTLSGFGGNDTLYGDDGNDVLRGGSDADVLYGGSGNDTFTGSASEHNGGSIMDLAIGDVLQITGVTGLSTANVRFNGSNLEIDTNATTFASSEVTITLNENKTGLLGFTVADFGSSTLVTFTSGNEAPTSSDASKSLAYNGSCTFSTTDFAFSDADTGDSLDHITVVTLPDKGILKLNGNNVSANDDISAANIGNLTFTLDDGGAGAGYTSFTFKVNDGTDDSTTAHTFTLDVRPPPEQTTPATTDTVDGTTTTTQESKDSQGNTVEVVTINPIAPSRQDSDGTSTGADVPFQFLNDDPNSVVTVLSLPTGVGAQILSNSTANTQNQATNLATLIRDTGADEEDSQDAQNAGSNFLANAGNSGNTWVNSVKLTSTGSTNSGPVLITGTSDTTQREAVVIDTRSVSGGAQLQLDNVEFSFISGRATVTGGAGQNYAHGDNEDQFIRLGADDDELHGGGGNDVVASLGGDDLLFGDSGDDLVIGGVEHDTLHGGTGNDTLQGGQSSQGNFTFSLNSQGQIVTHFTPDNSGLSDIETLTFTGDWYSQAVLVADGKTQNIDLSEGNISSVMEAGLMLQASSDYAFLSMDGERLEMLAAAYQGIFGERLNASDLTGLSGSQYSLSELANIGIQAWITQQGSDFNSLTAEQQVSAFLSSFWNTSEVTDQAIADVLSNLSNGMSAGELFLSVAQSQQAKDKLTTDQGLLQLTVSNKVSENGLSTDIGNDSLFGEAGDDTLVGGHGSDLLDGGEGTDTAVQLHNFAEYSIAQLDNGSITLTYQQGAYTEVDTLVDIEFVQFGDQLIGVNDLI